MTMPVLFGISLQVREDCRLILTKSMFCVSIALIKAAREIVPPCMMNIDGLIFCDSHKVTPAISLLVLV